MTAMMEAPEEVAVDLSNYEVCYGTFGPFVKGDLVALWWLQSKKHHIPSLIENGVLKRTDKAIPEHCHAKMIAEKPKTSVDATPAMQEEIDRLKRETDRLAQDNRLLAAERNELKEQSKIKDTSLGRQTTEIGRLNKLLDAAVARATFAETQLAELTKPKEEAKTEVKSEMKTTEPKKK